VAGGKYGASNARKAAKNVVGDTPLPRWSPPPESECDPKGPPLTYNLSASTRIIQRTRRKDSRIVDYSVQHEGRWQGWDPIMRVDCAHSEVHAHRFFPRPERREVMRAIHSQDDVEETHQQSYDLVLDEVDKNERYWRDARD